MTQSPRLDGLRTTMRLSTEPMVLSDPRLPDNPLVAVNAAFVALTGYPEEQIVGRNCRFLQGARTDAETVRQMGACLRDGQGCVQWLINYRRDGSAFWNLLFISPVYDEAKTLVGFFANQHNLSGDAPLDLAEVRMGVAHMSGEAQDEFNALLDTIGRAREGMAHVQQARALEASLASARQAVALLSRQLEAGPGA